MLRGLGESLLRPSREITARAETRWTAHFHLRPTRCSVCAKHRRVMGLENDHGCLELRDYGEGKRGQARYSFLFMRAHGGQLTEITSLIDDGIIRPVVDRVFPFASIKEAMAYV